MRNHQSTGAKIRHCMCMTSRIPSQGFMHGDVSWLQGFMHGDVSWLQGFMHGDVSWLQGFMHGDVSWLQGFMHGDVSWLQGFMHGDVSWLQGFIHTRWRIMAPGSHEHRGILGCTYRCRQSHNDIKGCSTDAKYKYLFWLNKLIN